MPGKIDARSEGQGPESSKLIKTRHALANAFVTHGAFFIKDSTVKFKRNESNQLINCMPAGQNSKTQSQLQRGLPIPKRRHMHAAYACCACCVPRTRTRAGTGGAMLWARRICARTLATSRGASQGNAITARGRDATQRDATSQSNAEPRHATQRGRPCAWPPAHPHLSTQLTPGVQGRSPCVVMSMKRRLNSAH